MLAEDVPAGNITSELHPLKLHLLDARVRPSHGKLERRPATRQSEDPSSSRPQPAILIASSVVVEHYCL